MGLWMHILRICDVKPGFEGEKELSEKASASFFFFYRILSSTAPFEVGGCRVVWLRLYVLDKRIPKFPRMPNFGTKLSRVSLVTWTVWYMCEGLHISRRGGSRRSHVDRGVISGTWGLVQLQQRTEFYISSFAESISGF